MTSKVLFLTVTVMCLAGVSQGLANPDSTSPAASNPAASNPTAGNPTAGNPAAAADPQKESPFKTLRQCCPDLPKVMAPKSWESCKGGDMKCKMECAFANPANNFLSEDKKSVNMVNLGSRLTSLAQGKWAVPMESAKAECTKLPTPVAGKQCTTGAREVSKCILDKLLPVCPAGCKEQFEKARAEKKASRMAVKKQAASKQ